MNVLFKNGKIILPKLKPVEKDCVFCEAANSC
jgi:hypothetical protein